MSTLTQIKHLQPLCGAERDDVLLCCASYEDRSVGVLGLMDDAYVVRHSWVFVSREYGKLGKSPAHLEQLRNGLARRAPEQIQPTVMEFSIDDPLPALLACQQELRRQLGEHSQPVCTLDVSCFPRQELLVLLRLLRRIPQLRLRLLYSEPSRYATEETGGWLTRGVRRVTSVPSLGGLQTPRKKKLLVMVLGHEGERAHITWRRHQAERTLIVMQGEPYRPGLNDISRKVNSLLCAMAGDPQIYPKALPARAVDGTRALLEDIYQRYGSEHNIVVAPLGTKLQTLGVYLFAESRPEVQVTYAVPVYYNWEHYSSGVERVWEIRDYGCSL